MAYVFVADDFTGASDTLATLASAGLKARLFPDLPTPADVEGLAAWGIATHARSLGREAITALGRRLGAGLRAFAPQILHLKICSTFDSSPETGNFIRFAEALAEPLGITDLAVLGGQPALGRFAIFGTLFARGPDGNTHRIDRHPVMSAHPVTPMHEADMLRHLEALGLNGLELVLRGKAGAGFPRFYDALDQADISAAGRDLFVPGQSRLVIGASSVAEAWIATRPGAPSSPVAAARPASSKAGPIFAFAGSRSSLTTTQIAAAESFARLPIDPADMLENGPARTAAASWLFERLGRGENCIAYLTADHAGPISPADLAEAAADFVTDLLCLQASPSRSGAAVAGLSIAGLVIAGGDSSSAILRRLAPRYLDHIGRVCPGVPILEANGAGWTLPLVLKGGQMGDNDFFERAARMIRDARLTGSSCPP